MTIPLNGGGGNPAPPGILHSVNGNGHHAGTNGHHASTASIQRFRKGQHCPICGGSEDDPRGQETRCWGYIGSDGKFAHCTRPEFAGRTAFNPHSQTYPHALKGRCPCGGEHAPADPKPTRPKLGKPVATYEYIENNELIYEVLKYANPKSFRQRRPGPGGKPIWDMKGIRRIPYRADHLRDDPTGLLSVVEGEKDVHTLVDNGFPATTNPGGAGKWPDYFADYLAGLNVVVLPDNDEPGRDHAEQVARSVYGKAASVSIIHLPDLPEGGDVSDYFARGGTVEGLKALIRSALPWAPPASNLPGSSLPTIVCGSEDPSEGLKTWTPAAMEALRKSNKPPRLFQRANILTRISTADDDEAPVLNVLSLDALRGEMDRSASWGSEHFNKKGESTVSFGPPRWDVVRDVASLPGWDQEIFPRLDSIVETPRFLADGQLLQEPGYHPGAHIFYAPPPGLRDLAIPDRPSVDEILDARSLILDDLLHDFPFANDASKAAAVAFTLLPFVRPMIQGPTPLHHVSASTEGTGKTLLVMACAYPSIGREINLSPQKENEAEWRKALTTVLMSGVTHYCVDNLYNPLGWDDSPLPIDSGTLAMCLTAPYYTDRKLGGNQDARIKVQAVFASTGNNTVFSRELNRRIVPIDLVATVENPSLRTGFKHNPLIEGFVQPRRRELLRACLMLIRCWINEGRPMGSEVMGRYESYAQVMGGILRAIGVSGFLANRVGMMGKNAESTRWAALIKLWAHQHKDMTVSASDIWATINSNSDLLVAFADIIGDKSPLSQKQKLGKALEKQRNHVWGDSRITSCGARGRNGSLLYRLKPSSDPYSEPADDDEDDD